MDLEDTVLDEGIRESPKPAGFIVYRPCDDNSTGRLEPNSCSLAYRGTIEYCRGACLQICSLQLTHFYVQSLTIQNQDYFHSWYHQHIKPVVISLTILCSCCSFVSTYQANKDSLVGPKLIITSSNYLGNLKKLRVNTWNKVGNIKFVTLKIKCIFNIKQFRLVQSHSG